MTYIYVTLFFLLYLQACLRGLCYNIFLYLQGCLRGYRPDAKSVCKACEEEPKFYDWLFLGFMALLSLLLHWFFIDFTNKRKKWVTNTKESCLHKSVYLYSISSQIVKYTLLLPCLCLYRKRETPYKWSINFRRRIRHFFQFNIKEKETQS